MDPRVLTRGNKHRTCKSNSLFAAQGSWNFYSHHLTDKTTKRAGFYPLNICITSIALSYIYCNKLK